MKIAFVAVAGMVLGLGGGAAMGALRVKGEILEARAKAVADSTALAHAAVPEGTGDHGAVSVVLPPATEDEPVSAADHEQVSDSGVPEPAADHPVDAAPSGASPAAAVEGGATILDAGPVEEATPVTGPAPAPADPEAAKKLAKIFGAMKPVDAAAVLAAMTDEEVTVILLQMSDRQAAPIVGNFPAERAALLSRVVLRGGGAS